MFSFVTVLRLNGLLCSAAQFRRALIGDRAFHCTRVRRIVCMSHMIFFLDNEPYELEW